jgi:hypothetical protein
MSAFAGMTGGDFSAPSEFVGTTQEFELSGNFSKKAIFESFFNGKQQDSFFYLSFLDETMSNGFGSKLPVSFTVGNIFADNMFQVGTLHKFAIFPAELKFRQRDWIAVI